MALHKKIKQPGHLMFTLSFSAFFQETMTDPSVYAEDVSKLKDADELKQACIGLKDTNRYCLTASSPHHSKPRLHLAKSCLAFAPLIILP